MPLRSRPFVVVIVGPDGAGKSTVADALEVELHRGGLAVRRTHGRPGTLVPKLSSERHVPHPHARSVRGVLTSALKLAVLFADHFVDRIGPSGSIDVRIIERGWYDLAVDPRRYRIHGSLVPAIRLLGRLLPRADLAVLLDGDPDVLAARKGELDEVSVSRQLDTWDDLVARAGRAVIRVDTVRDDAEAIASELMDLLPARFDDASTQWQRVPLTPARLDLRVVGSPNEALSVQRTLTRRTQLGRLVAPRLLAIGLAPRAEPPPFDVRGILQEVGVVPSGIVAFRSSHPGRWVFGVEEAGQFCLVLKFGSEHDRPLRHEVAVLSELAEAEEAPVPDVVFAGTWRDDIVLATRARPSCHGPPSIATVARMCTRLTQGFREIGPVVHGDLAPWNVVGPTGHMVLVDWEEAAFERRPMHDLCHYLIRAGSRLGWMDPETVAGLLTHDGSPGRRHLEQLGEDPRSAWDWILRYLDVTGADDDPRESRFRWQLRERAPG